MEQPSPPATYRKVTFTRPGDRPVGPGATHAGVRWSAVDDPGELVGVVARVLPHSPDAGDRDRVARLGPAGAARWLIDAPPAWGTHHRPGWWQLLRVDDEAVGFVLPVVYDGCARDGRDEGTVFHLGVVPRWRGRGLGRALLHRATGVLVDHGVWRITCDTDVDNVPMVAAFVAEGWDRGPVADRPLR